jgi:hypothetical protein
MPNVAVFSIPMSDDNPQIGFQGGDEEGEMPPEMKDHMLAAFAHKAGLGPHPGKYKGPPWRKSDDPTDADMQRAEEEPIEEEASAKKMHAAQTGGSIGLGPSAMDQAAIKQRGAMNQQADTQAAAQAAKAQGAQVPVNAPPAPSGPAGSVTTFPAQKDAVGGPGDVQQPSQAAPPPGGPPPEGDDESDPSTQWPPS